MGTPAQEGTVIATLAQLCLDAPVRDRPAPGPRPAHAIRAGHCPVAAGRASVQGVGGMDAWLAARLSAGDERALAEVFDGLARTVYGSARRSRPLLQKPARSKARTKRIGCS